MLAVRAEAARDGPEGIIAKREKGSTPEAASGVISTIRRTRREAGAARPESAGSSGSISFWRRDRG